MSPTVHEHAFGDASWALAIALSFTVLGLAVLLRLLWRRQGLPAWQGVLSVLLVGVSLVLGGLAWRDCSTKVAFVRLETDPPRLTLERRLPRRTRVLLPGELRGIGLLSLGATLDDEKGGERQLLFSIEGEREIRSFLEHEPPRARAIAERIAAAFGLELQRFAGPPPLKKDRRVP